MLSDDSLDLAVQLKYITIKCYFNWHFVTFISNNKTSTILYTDNIINFIMRIKLSIIEFMLEVSS